MIDHKLIKSESDRSFNLIRNNLENLYSDFINRQKIIFLLEWWLIRIVSVHKAYGQKGLDSFFDSKFESVLRFSTMEEFNKDILHYLSPKNWAENINIKTFIMHGANDSMVPFTESTMLAKKIRRSRTLISFLFEHREMSSNRGIFFKIKEIFKMINFFASYFKFNR